MRTFPPLPQLPKHISCYVVCWPVTCVTYHDGWAALGTKYFCHFRARLGGARDDQYELDQGPTPKSQHKNNNELLTAHFEFLSNKMYYNISVGWFLTFMVSVTNSKISAPTPMKVNKIWESWSRVTPDAFGNIQRPKIMMNKMSWWNISIQLRSVWRNGTLSATWKDKFIWISLSFRYKMEHDWISGSEML